MRRHLPLLLLRACLAACLVLCGSCVFAQVDQISPDAVPPDVTVPTGASPYAPAATGSSPAGSDFGAYHPGSGQQTQAPGQAAAGQNDEDPVALITTQKGVITIRLFRKYAPATVANFIDLCDRGFYDGTSFHRVEPGFVIQGGDPNGNGSGLFIDPATNTPRFINLEINPHLRHNAPGVVAMARFGKNPNTASCQFYITLSPQPKLDNQYAVFAGVINGMDVVKQIAKGDKIISIKVQGQ